MHKKSGQAHYIVQYDFSLTEWWSDGSGECWCNPKGPAFIEYYKDGLIYSTDNWYTMKKPIPKTFKELFLS